MDNIKQIQEKIDANLLNGSIEITLLNRIYKDKLIDEKIYKQAKENIIKEYKLEKCEIDFNFWIVYNPNRVLSNRMED